MIVDRINKLEEEIKRCNQEIRRLLWEQAMLYFKNPRVGDCWKEIDIYEQRIKIIKSEIKQILN